MSRYSDLLPLLERLEIAYDQLLRQYLTQMCTYRLNFLLDCSLYDLLLHVMRHPDEVSPQKDWDDNDHDRDSDDPEDDVGVGIDAPHRFEVHTLEDDDCQREGGD